VQNGPWSQVAIVTELGGMLRAMGRRAPHGHQAFSELVFGQDFSGAEVINEGDVEGEPVIMKARIGSHMRVLSRPQGCGYLEDDDIEDW